MFTTWTDYPAGATTPIRALHIAQVRTAVDTARAAYTPHALPPGGWTPAAWTDPGLNSSTPIRAVHFTELKTPMQQLWDKRQLGAIPNWASGAAPASGAPIRATDINDLRNWFNQYEAGLKRGIRINLYSSSSQRRIDNQLASNAADLFGSGPVYFVGLLDSDNTTHMDRYVDAFNRLKSQRSNSVGIVLLPKELVGLGEASPDDPLGAPVLSGFPPANHFIDLYRQRVRTIADYLVARGIQRFIVYNEPNATPPPGGYPVMPPDRFASLLYYCWYWSLESHAQSEGYAGALHWFGDTGSITTIHDWLDDIRSWLQANANLYAGWPWNAVCFTNHGGAVDPSTAWADWRAVLNGYGDGAPFVVTEWGEPTNDICTKIAATYSQTVAPGEEHGLKEVYFYSYDVHPDPTGSYTWGVVNYVDSGTEFYTFGSDTPGRACANPFIG